MKTRFKVELFASNDLVNGITEAICNHNSGESNISLLDISGFVRFQKARYIYVFKNIEIVYYGVSSLLISNDGKPIITVEEIELHELKEEEGIGALAE